ncbi:MAG TPA: hypothetical protein VJT72_06615, partial [Pseudonocardiaceae bacterium]|nr:hypothetical protein [Pseudonocardiaceae bacterium]
VESSQQTIETRPMPPNGAIPRRRRIDRLIADRDTTPGKLRVTRIILVLGILLAGSVAAFAAQARVATTGDIEHLEKLNANVTTLYRSLADADSTVALAFLSGGGEPPGPRIRYEQDRALASETLGRAATQIGEEPETVNLITDINKELPVYTGYVERVRANNRQGNTAAGRAYLGLASELMKNSILPRAAELQQRQAARLDDAYRRAESVPIVALAAGTVSLTGLIWAQVFVFQRTHRVVNLGLAAASGAVLVGLVWWTTAGMVSAGALQSSHRHIQSVSGALGPAQIAALGARAIETNRLVSTSGTATEGDFSKQIQLLQTYLDAAQQFNSDQEGRAHADVAVRNYTSAHAEFQNLDKVGADAKAIDTAVNATAAKFIELDQTITNAVDRQRTAFGDNIRHAQGWWLTGLPIGTGLLAFAAAVGVALGIRQRLEEYR